MLAVDYVGTMLIEEKIDEILDRKEVTNEDLVNAMSMYLSKAL